MLPDLSVLDQGQPTETSDHSREEIRKVCIEAITQATAVAITNRALRTNATVTGQHYYDEGDLVDYHCPTTTMDDWGGWNGPFPAVRNDPEKAREIGSDSAALRTVLTFLASVPAGRPAMTCGYAPTKKGTLQMISASRLSLNVHLVLQYLMRNVFRIEN
eukprot:5769580-Pyramimonas_sp.AAC.1